MDANGTRFHLLLGEADWGRCRQGTHPLSELWGGAGGEAPLVAWDAARSELTLQRQLFRFTPAPRDVPPELSERRGAARDRSGNVYAVSASRAGVEVTSSGSGDTAVFWPLPPAPPPPRRPGDFEPQVPPPPPAFGALGGAAVTTHHRLLVGTGAPAGLALFDLSSGGPPEAQLPWPADVPFAPWDVSAARDGGALVLDREQRRYWRVDRRFEVVSARQPPATPPPEAPDAFQPADGSATRTSPARTGPSLDASAAVAAADPISIEALPDGRALILDRGAGAGSAVLLYDGDQLQGQPVALQAFGAAVVAHDMAFVAGGGAEGVLGRVYVATAEGNQAIAFTARVHEGQLTLTAEPEYFPMRLFGGRALFAGGGQVFYDSANGFVPLAQQARPRYEPSAAVLSPPFDGRDPDCVWHRVFLDACIPAGASVQVWSRAANEREDLDAAIFTPEPDLHLREGGSELPWTPSPSGAGGGTWEVLFQRAKGRWMQLQLVLAGGGSATPRLRALRAYYPRFSYLGRYLPAIYRQDPEAASFLDRFLANPEGTLTALEDRIASMQVLFDPQSAPAEALDWLASWFGMALDPAWDEPRRRLFIRHALDFFQWRGTARGLSMALRLALDDEPGEELFDEERELPGQRIRIVEKFRAARTPARFQRLEGEANIRQVASAGQWDPSQGGSQLARRYADALGAAGVSPAPARYPARAPSDPAAAEVWRAFSLGALGFLPAGAAADVSRWRDFLARRYRRVADLNAAHRSVHERFSAVPLPESLPDDGPAQVDWWQFQSIVVPIAAAAHRFTVYLPVPAGGDAESFRAKVEHARRVVELEKPVHAVFDVQLYWAMFRIGEARLGVGSLIDAGSRASGLMPPMHLGAGHLAEGYLTPRAPQDATDRRILGRDSLAGPPHGSDHS